ncbi:MAG TPA: polyamine aminopropyltransferase [Burkholderiaceae bacterium]|nr:polyamine aminopropyltransferase [Burkholderiaceae bacterium]
MQGLHLTGDLFECGCSAALLTDLGTLSSLCRNATNDSTLTIVDDKWHVFPDWNGQPGGITGTILLAESHLAIHTWPERRGVTLDVYVCNFTADNTGKAEQLFEALTLAFRPTSQVVNRIIRGDLAADDATHVAERQPAEGVARNELIFDWLNAHSGYGYTATEKLAEIQSPYQRVEVYDTQQFGKLFRLDGRLMTSEGDEFFYHECMTHPAALAHPYPESILVIGGGDGGSSEELFKHPSVKRIVMAELDPVVIDVSKKWLGSIHKDAFSDPRLEVKIGDGFEFVKSTQERFDLIVLDLTDPDTPAFHLYSEEFFRMCQRILKPGGMLTLHLGSPVYQGETVRKNAANLRKVFRHVAPMSLFIPLYGSLWCLAVASDSIDPRSLSVDTLAQRMSERRIGGLRYYYAGLHQALFTLPLFVHELTQPPSCAAGSTPRVPQLRAA